MQLYKYSDTQNVPVFPYRMIPMFRICEENIAVLLIGCLVTL